jgi:hypothetical protein
MGFLVDGIYVEVCILGDPAAIIQAIDPMKSIDRIYVEA